MAKLMNFGDAPKETVELVAKLGNMLNDVDERLSMNALSSLLALITAKRAMLYHPNEPTLAGKQAAMWITEMTMAMPKAVAINIAEIHRMIIEDIGGPPERPQ